MPDDDDNRATIASGSEATKQIGVPVINALTAAYAKGGLVLVLLIIVAICILVGGIGYYKDTSQRVIPLAALSLGFAVLCLFLFVFVVNVYLPVRKAIRTIKDSEELMNAVQDSSLQLADLVTQINNFALLHSDRILEAIHKLREMFADIPMAERFLPMTEFTETEEFGRSVISLAHDAREVIDDIRTSISNADGTRIRTHLQRLRDLNQKLHSSIIEPARQTGAARVQEHLAPVVARATQTVDDYKQLFAALQSNTMILTSLVIDLTDYASRNGERVAQAISGIKGIPFAKPLLDSRIFRAIEEIGDTLSRAAALLQQETGDLEQSIQKPDLLTLTNAAVKLASLSKRLKPEISGQAKDRSE